MLTGWLPLLAVVLLVLGGCASGPQTTRGSQDVFTRARPAADGDIEQLLSRAEQLPSPQAERSYLQAARMLMDRQRHADAERILENLELADLETVLATEILILRARLRLENNRPEAALTLLGPDLPSPVGRLPENLQRQLRLLRAQAYLANNQALASALERIQADSLLQGAEQQQNHELIWNALTALPAEQLVSLAAQAQTVDLRGWYELAHIGKAYQYDLDRQLEELAGWQQRWSRHPAALLMPRSLQMAQTLADERPERLALLLPLSTPAGRVIRDGFMSAYFNAQETGAQVPVIRFYDSGGPIDIVDLHRQARADGAELIIGPLQKQRVARLLDVPDLGVPTLALNAIEGVQPRDEKLYQFALSPESEAAQIARRAWQDGHRLAAILSPDAGQDDYYARKRQSFIAQWEELGGTVVAQEVFRDDYTETIENLLNLRASEYRKDQLAELLGRPLEFTQRRRQDIDFIFLIAQPGAARQIKPSLAYLYAGDIPVYATQDVYSGLPRPMDDQDLNGILFGESPWLLISGDDLQEQTQALFPQNNALYLRLQAFGVDAFRLYPRLRQLELIQQSQIYGATGLLRMDQDRTITRQLNWARFEGGLVEPLHQLK